MNNSQRSLIAHSVEVFESVNNTTICAVIHSGIISDEGSMSRLQIYILR